ncbi:MAG: peptide ABC transporter substrate-binding protein [Clostridia bacterium]|nr:peptide ABC transporter substrate-binding protein [Clostridia bacterium]
MKKLFALLTALVMVMAFSVSALADAGSEPDWTAYDARIAQIKSTTDFAERVKLMHEAEDELMETGAIVPLYYYNDVYMAREGLTGYYSNAYATKFFMYADYGENTTLKLQLASEPDKLDPALNSSVDGACLAANSFGGLYTYDAQGELAPNFATGYTVSDDGLTYVFSIREGLKWSDGTDLTAADFEYSWKRAASDETAADYSYMFDGIAGYPDDLQVSASEDGTTFTVVLKSPCAYMLDLAAFPTFFPVQKACVEASATPDNPGAWALEAGFVTSGAYTLESWDHNVSMVYVKNPYYWDAENVKLERLEFMLSDDDTAIFAAYQNGDLDFTDSVPTDQIASLLDNPEFHIVDELGTYYVAFNVKSKLFDGLTVEQAANVRKALGLLIDRQYIVDTVGQTGQKVATSFLPAGMLNGNGGIFKDAAEWNYPNGSDGYYAEDPDIDQAIELLKSAGYEFDANNMLSASTPLSFEYLTNNTSGHIAAAECMQQDFAQIGINMTIKSIDWAVFLNERKEGNYDVAREGWIADFNDPINMLEMWTTVSGNNDAQFGR